jgi:hypothetical protein
MDLTSGVANPSPVSHLTPIYISGPAKITKPGYYRLTDDIIPSGDNELPGTPTQICIKISSSDVTLDGMGHTIDGKHITKMKTASEGNAYSLPSSGIAVYGYYENDWASDVIISNITIQNWYWGITGYHMKNSEVRNIVATNNNEGIFLTHTSGIVIQNSTFIQNDYDGIKGTDVENTLLINNEIKYNRNDGISLDGKLQQAFFWNIFGREIILPGIYFDQSQTSGNRQVIIQNSVSDSNNGISIANSNSNKIVSNTITNTSTGISLYNCGPDKILENNTFFQTQEKTSIENPEMPLSLLLGVILIILFKVFANGINIAVEIVTKPLKGKFFFKPETPAGLMDEPTTSVFHWHLPIFVRNNLFESVLGAIILGGAFTYAQYGRIDLFSLAMLTLIAGVVIVSHEFVHFFTAQRLGLHANFRIWGVGVIITLLSSVVFRNVFGQSVLTTIQNEDECDREKLALVMLSGPIISLILSSGFYALYLMQGTYSSLAMIGFEMSLVTAFVSFLPITSLDGERVFKWNKLIWASAFIPIYMIYGYFFIYSDVLVLAISVVLGAIVFGFWHMRKSVKGKNIGATMSRWTRYLLISIAVLVIARLTNYVVAGYRNYSSGIFSFGTPLNNMVLTVTTVLTIGALIAIVISACAVIVGVISRKK